MRKKFPFCRQFQNPAFSRGSTPLCCLPKVKSRSDVICHVRKEKSSLLWQQPGFTVHVWGTRAHVCNSKKPGKGGTFCAFSPQPLSASYRGKISRKISAINKGELILVFRSPQ